MAKVTLNVFRDKDGDYLVTNAPLIVAGISAYQLAATVDEDGGPLAYLDQKLPSSFIFNVGVLADGPKGSVADIIAENPYELIESAEVDADHGMVEALLA